MTIQLEDCIQAEERTFFNTSMERRYGILLYELGNITRSCIYGLHTLDQKERNSLLANAVIEMADLITQIDMFRHQILKTVPDAKYRPSLEELIQDGRERQIERMQEFYKKNGGQTSGSMYNPWRDRLQRFGNPQTDIQMMQYQHLEMRAREFDKEFNSGSVKV